MRMAALGFASAVSTAIILASGPASATITNIDLSSYYNGNWSGEINGAAVAAGAESGSGNTGTGLTFSDPSGKYDSIDTSGAAITFAGVSLTGNSLVSSLMNQFFGPTGAAVVFTNSASQTATFTLTSNATIRDYNNDGFNNSLSGSGTGVTAVNWWKTATSGGNGEPDQRLDAQTFKLPSAWAGTQLVNVDITNLGDGTTVLSALQVNAKPSSTVPEPGSLALLATAMIAFAGLKTRRPAA